MCGLKVALRGVGERHRREGETPGKKGEKNMKFQGEENYIKTRHLSYNLVHTC